MTFYRFILDMGGLCFGWAAIYDLVKWVLFRE
jgi:hypothetical protein